MTGYVFSPAARADLEGIWDYTARTWGDAQTELYILLIRDACEALGDGTRQGRAIDDIRPGYRTLPVGSHFLFYRFTQPDLIEIVRILHRRMDVPGHLTEP